MGAAQVVAIWSVATEQIPDDEEARHKILWSSVIRRAIIDWVLYRGARDIRKRRLFQDANAWIFEDDRDLFDEQGTTFKAACAVLNVGPESIRIRVRCIEREQLIELRRAYSGHEDK